VATPRGRHLTPRRAPKRHGRALRDDCRLHSGLALEESNVLREHIKVLVVRRMLLLDRFQSEQPSNGFPDTAKRSKSAAIPLQAEGIEFHYRQQTLSERLVRPPRRGRSIWPPIAAGPSPRVWAAIVKAYP
jgi:hypothetical protein